MKVSVILLAYYGERWLPECLSSLETASENTLHLLLVDNAGENHIEKLDLSRFRSEVISTPEIMGFAEANNFALSAASHLEDFVVFLNQDTTSDPGWIDSCLQSFSTYPELGAVSPLIRTYHDDGWDPSFLARLDDRQQTLLESETFNGSLFQVTNIPAPAMMIRANVLRKAGPFDPVYGSYYEDYDLCRRIRNLGYRVGFCRDARIRHFSGGSTTTRKQENERMRKIIRNRMLYNLRENDNSRWYSALLMAIKDFPRRLARGIVGTSSSQPPSVILKAYWDLLKMGDRLLSRRRDERRWQEYLDGIGWPPKNLVESQKVEGRKSKTKKQSKVEKSKVEKSKVERQQSKG